MSLVPGYIHFWKTNCCRQVVIKIILELEEGISLDKSLLHWLKWCLDKSVEKFTKRNPFVKQKIEILGCVKNYETAIRVLSKETGNNRFPVKQQCKNWKQNIVFSVELNRPKFIVEDLTLSFKNAIAYFTFFKLASEYLILQSKWKKA